MHHGLQEHLIAQHLAMSQARQEQQARDRRREEERVASVRWQRGLCDSPVPDAAPAAGVNSL